jgi:hypothetical protein
MQCRPISSNKRFAVGLRAFVLIFLPALLVLALLWMRRRPPFVSYLPTSPASAAGTGRRQARRRLDPGWAVILAALITAAATIMAAYQQHPEGPWRAGADRTQPAHVEQCADVPQRVPTMTRLRNGAWGINFRRGSPMPAADGGPTPPSMCPSSWGRTVAQEPGHNKDERNHDPVSGAQQRRIGAAFVGQQPPPHAAMPMPTTIALLSPLGTAPSKARARAISGRDR